jgi:hypothetical protein
MHLIKAAGDHWPRSFKEKVRELGAAKRGLLAVK